MKGALFFHMNCPKFNSNLTSIFTLTLNTFILKKLREDVRNSWLRQLFRFGLFIIDLAGIKTFSIGVKHSVSFLRRNGESSLVAVTGIRLLTHQAGLHAGYLILPGGLFFTVRRVITL
jgi:hypothetical protein